MSVAEFGAIGDFVSSRAVLAALADLALQVRGTGTAFSKSYSMLCWVSIHPICTPVPSHMTLVTRQDNVYRAA